MVSLILVEVFLKVLNYFILFLAIDRLLCAIYTRFPAFLWIQAFRAEVSVTQWTNPRFLSKLVLVRTTKTPVSHLVEKAGNQC